MAPDDNAYFSFIRFTSAANKKEKKSLKGDSSSSSSSPRYNMDWESYHSHDDINAFIDELADTYSWVETVSIGSTYEGRDMRVIQINKAGPDAPTVWVEAGIYRYLRS